MVVDVTSGTADVLEEDVVVLLTVLGDAVMV